MSKHMTYANPELADWERELLSEAKHDEGEGNVVFTLHDGSTLKVENVRVDSIGPSAENRGVIGVEFFHSDHVVHVPFVRFWEVTYNV